MLDVKFIRDNLDQAEATLATRGGNVSLAGFRELDARRRKLLTESETLKALKNSVSDEISRVKDKSTVKDKIAEMKDVSAKIKTLDDELKTVEEEFGNLLMTVPNLPHATTPIGKSEDDNVVVRSWGVPPVFDFPVKAHWISAKIWASLILNGAPRSPVPVSAFPKGPGRDWSGR